MSASPAEAPVDERLPIRVIGAAAQRALARGAAGRVIATFERSFYVATEAGTLACFGAAALGPGPLNVLIEAGRAHAMVITRMVEGASVAVTETTVAVGPVHFSLAGATAWEPVRVANAAATLARERTRLALAAATLPHTGLAPLAKAAFLDRAALGSARSTDPLLEAAFKPFAALAGWLGDALALVLGQPLAPVPAVVATLIGLGPGLTPSGDDLIGGTLVVLREVGRPDIADALAAFALPLAERSTGAVSLAHLRAAAAGEAAAALHDFLAALARGSDEALAAALTNVGGVGHSSGLDALAGIACVLARLP